MKTQNTKEEIQKEIAILDAAYKAGLLPTNEYCSLLNVFLKKMKSI